MTHGARAHQIFDRHTAAGGRVVVSTLCCCTIRVRRASTSTFRAAQHHSKEPGRCFARRSHTHASACVRSRPPARTSTTALSSMAAMSATEPLCWSADARGSTETMERFIRRSANQRVCDISIQRDDFHQRRTCLLSCREVQTMRGIDTGGVDRAMSTFPVHSGCGRADCDAPAPRRCVLQGRGTAETDTPTAALVKRSGTQKLGAEPRGSRLQIYKPDAEARHTPRLRSCVL